MASKKKSASAKKPKTSLKDPSGEIFLVVTPDGSTALCPPFADSDVADVLREELQTKRGEDLRLFTYRLVGETEL